LPIYRKKSKLLLLFKLEMFRNTNSIFQNFWPFRFFQEKTKKLPTEELNSGPHASKDGAPPTEPLTVLYFVLFYLTLKTNFSISVYRQNRSRHHHNFNNNQHCLLSGLIFQSPESFYVFQL
jgi:hypothetical protein